MTNLPPTIEAAIDSAVEAYREKLRAESRITLAIHSGDKPTSDQYAAMTHARAAHILAHNDWYTTVLREAIG